MDLPDLTSRVSRAYCVRFQIQIHATSLEAPAPTLGHPVASKKPPPALDARKRNLAVCAAHLSVPCSAHAPA